VLPLEALALLPPLQPSLLLPQPLPPPQLFLLLLPHRLLATLPLPSLRPLLLSLSLLLVSTLLALLLHPLPPSQLLPWLLSPLLLLSPPLRLPRLSLPALPPPVRTAHPAPTMVLSSALAPAPSVFATAVALFLRRSLPAWPALTAQLVPPLLSALSLVRTFTSATVLAFVSSKRDAPHRLTIDFFLHLSL
jgi:hypothetical protein